MYAELFTALRDLQSRSTILLPLAMEYDQPRRQIKRFHLTSSNKSGLSQLI